MRRGILAILILVIGCGGEKEPAPATESPEGAPSTPEEMSSQSSSETLPEEGRLLTPPTGQGVVLANKELGMTVSGQGTDSPERSLDVLEQRVLSLLPELRDVYEHERIQDPALMGSLDVSMVIESNGGVSDLRFPVKRVSHDRLTSAVFNQMRAWIFPTAVLPVQLHFTLLFVPPGVDEASILQWEKRLGSRPVVEKVGESLAPAVTVALAGKEPGEEAQLEKPLEAPSTTPAKARAAEKKLASAKDSRAKERKESAPSEITGWYRVLYPTALRSAPQPSAKVITQLQRGTRLRVVNVVRGQWLEIRSVSDRPPGFLWWEDAALESTERAERR